VLLRHVTMQLGSALYDLQWCMIKGNRNAQKQYLIFTDYIWEHKIECAEYEFGYKSRIKYSLWVTNYKILKLRCGLNNSTIE
jgi:hypothetical protein